MEDQVPFKVFMMWEPKGKPEVRRFGIEKSMVTTFKHLRSKILDVYPELGGKLFSISWKDEEGDNVHISSDEELVTAMTSMGTGMIKLFISLKKPIESFPHDILFSASAMATGNPDATGKGAGFKEGNIKINFEPVNLGPTCSNCDWPIVGFRYKCVVCPEYDLCCSCESGGNHRDHCMMRLPTAVMPRPLLKAAIKRSRNFLKNAGCVEGNDKKFKGKDKNQDEASARRSEHYRRIRSSWLGTLANYMNEFANLAGDFDLDIDIKPKDKEAQEPEKAKPEPKDEPKKEAAKDEPKKEEKKKESRKERARQEKLKAEQAAAKEAEQQKQAEAGTASQSNAVPNVDEIQKLLNKYMNEYSNFMTTPVQLSVNGRPTVVRIPPINPGGKCGPKKAAEPTAPAPPKSDTGSDTSDRENSPDKTDEWTVIHEKDVTGPVDTTVHVTFNLPEEFKERMKIGEGSNLYPPLNTATAVLNPKEPELSKAQQETNFPPQAQQPAEGQAAASPQASDQAQAAPKPQVTPAQATAPAQAAAPAQSAAQTQAAAPGQAAGSAQAAGPAQAAAHGQAPFQTIPIHAELKHFPHLKVNSATRYHNKPHIDAAIRCMLSMGFTNEGGWLTSLLESKDGNIAAVIDMLNPVTPKNL